MKIIIKFECGLKITQLTITDNKIFVLKTFGAFLVNPWWSVLLRKCTRNGKQSYTSTDRWQKREIQEEKAVVLSIGVILKKV